MERPQSNIISFIAKQLKYETLPTDVLVDICLTAYSTADIVNTRNIVIDAFGENIDYTQPRTTHTTDIRGDLLRIFHFLKLFPCAVGQERQYTEHIEKRALVARLDGMSQIVSGLCHIFKKPEEIMPSGNFQPGQCSNAADSGEASAQRQDNPLVQPVEPINQDLNMQAPAKQAMPENDENGSEMPGFNWQFPIEDIHDEPDPDRVGAGLQALSVNPPTQMLGPEEEVSVDAPLPNQGQEGVRVNSLIRLMVSSEQQNRDDARVSSLRVEWVDSEQVYAPAAVEMPIVQQPTDQTPVEQPRVDAPAEKPGASSIIQDDSSIDPVEDDLSSLSSDSTTSSTVSSDEDYVPLVMLKSGPNRPTMMLPEARRQVPRPIAPPARRFQFEGLPEPSQPILIPKPIHPLPDWMTDDESPTSEPSCSKRRRRMGRPE